MPCLCQSCSLLLAVAEFACIDAASTLRRPGLRTDSYPVIFGHDPAVSGSRASTVCIDLDDFDYDCSRSIEISSPVSSGIVDRGVVSSEELGEVVPSDISTLTSRFQPLNPRQSPVPMSSEEQVVVDEYFPDTSPVTSLDARNIPSSPVASALC